jgi:RHS repeat-associated protein
MLYKSNDHLGNARVVTGSAGTVIGSTDLYPYGEIWSDTGTTSKYKFTGKERDSESGNDFFGKRYYWNGAGRWLRADPLRGNLLDPQRLNKYSYSLGDPVNYVDPDGGNPVAVVDLNCVNITQMVEAPRGDPIKRVTQSCSVSVSLMFNPSQVVTARQERGDDPKPYENSKCPTGREAVAQGLKFGPEAAGQASIFADDATRAAQARVASGDLTGIHNGPADAFRHCMWSCLMAEWLSPTIAEGIGILHEDCTRNNPPAERAMDLFNNKIGITIGANNYTIRQNNGIPQNNCETSCREAVDNGLQTSLDN